MRYDKPSIDQLKKTFERVFLESPTGVAFAPARINVIGEHIDYNGGLTLPFAIDRGTYGVFRERTDQKLYLYAANYDDLIGFEPDEILAAAKEHWSDYVRGAYLALQRYQSFEFRGLDLLLWGNIPDAAGLSSSASLELLVLKIFMSLYLESEVDPVTFAKLGQWVENDFIGLQTGLMDQMAIAGGKKNHALLFDSRTVSFERIPMDLEGCRFLVMNSRKRRELRESKYNERRAECEFIDELLQEADRLPSPELPLAETGTRLCSLTEAELNSALDVLSSALGGVREVQIPGGFQTTLEALEKRLRHVVTEEGRVHEAVTALKAGKMEVLGQLLKASHASLSQDYEVAGFELDQLVGAANACPGVLGARMCGAGFGGSAIALCAPEIKEEDLLRVQERYTQATGLKAEFFFVEAADAPMILV